MKASDLRTKSDSELNEELHGLLRERFNLRMQKGTGQLGNPARMKSVHRDIARVKTIMNEKAAGGAE